MAIGKLGSLLKLARDGTIIIALTLLVDFTVTQFLPPALLDPNERARLNDQQVADFTVSYNHALKPNLGPLQRQFGTLSVTYRTDRFGFRTGACAGTDPATQGNSSVFVVGDSFTEGVGVAFEESFAGLMACEWKKHGLAVWNLGVQAYSPTDLLPSHCRRRSEDIDQAESHLRVPRYFGHLR